MTPPGSSRSPFAVAGAGPNGFEAGAPDWIGAGWPAIDWAACTHRSEAGGFELNYVDTGDAGGEPLLLIHGLGGSWEAWLPTLAALRDEYRVLAVDLPGFGASPVDRRAVTVAAFARVLDEFCSGLALDRVTVVGNSLGGWVAAELAIRNPQLVRRLVLIDAAGIPPTWRERFKVVSMLRLAGWLAPLAGRLRGPLLERPGLRRRAFSFAFADPTRVDVELLARQLPRRASPVFQKVMTAGIRSWSLAWCDRVTEIVVPTLVIWGESDVQLPMRHAREWLRLIAGSELVVVPGAGHLPMLERPDVVNEAIHDFIQATGTAGAGTDTGTGQAGRAAG